MDKGYPHLVSTVIEFNTKRIYKVVQNILA